MNKKEIIQCDNHQCPKKDKCNLYLEGGVNINLIKCCKYYV